MTELSKILYTQWSNIYLGYITFELFRVA